MAYSRNVCVSRWGWRLACVAGAVTIAGIVFAALWSLAGTGAYVPARQPVVEASEAEVRDLCTRCHQYPSPDTFPRSRWGEEIELAFHLTREAGISFKNDDPPRFQRYFENRAPLELPFEPLRSVVAETGWRFDAKAIRLPGDESRPIITDVKVAALGDTENELLVCDARTNQVLALDMSAQRWRKLGDAEFPARAEVVDLDGDGVRDVLVANLGVFFPSDERKGSVVWLRGRLDGSFERSTLLDGVGRVSDVRAGDFNGDGKPDLVVAVFGWRRTGELLLLQNNSPDRSRPTFERRVLDARHGTVETAIVDVNRDGALDIIAAFAQEHEEVVSFLNDGRGQFRSETIYKAPHPAFGCSCMQVADIDGDGDADVLLANGDVLDAPYLLKPYHGVRWLENQGTFPFREHLIGALHGVMCVRAADFDEDDDVDVAAVCYLPASRFPQRRLHDLAAVVIWEQTRQGEFVPHVVRTVDCDHLTCAAGRLHGADAVSLIVGHGDFVNQSVAMNAVTLFEPSKRQRRRSSDSRGPVPR